MGSPSDMHMIFCLRCGTKHTMPEKICSVCSRTNTIVSIISSKRQIKQRKGVKTVRDIRNMHTTGKYIPGFKELGMLPETVGMFLYGLPGSGKSTLALQMANNFKGGPALYCAIEEGISDSIKSKIESLEIAGEHILLSDCKNREELETDIGAVKPALVVLDSITELNGNFTHKGDYSTIIIAHSRKDGVYKGDSSLGHSCDIIIRCHKGIAVVEKNRFARAGSKIVILESARDVDWRMNNEIF